VTGSILLDISDAVATVTLNRPDVLNSFNRDMAANMQAILLSIGDNEAVRAVLLTGAGRAFCAGQDLVEVKPVPGEESQLSDIVRSSYNPIVRLIRSIEKPFVCAVNGVAAGAGANLAFACDLVYASEKASFIQSFSKVGLVPDTGGSYLLPRMVGPQKAAELMMLGDRLSASDAQALGLVSGVFPADELANAVRDIAKRLANLPTLGLGLTKRAINESFSNTLDEQLELEADLQQIAGSSADYAEGVDAFVNKREPKFTGR
jgi:2-(1,2-epoxy-1,2-dihydrophenyl)acetyl-CoA isomerase